MSTKTRAHVVGTFGDFWGLLGGSGWARCAFTAAKPGKTQAQAKNTGVDRVGGVRHRVRAWRRESDTTTADQIASTDQYAMHTRPGREAWPTVGVGRPP